MIQRLIYWFADQNCFVFANPSSFSFLAKYHRLCLPWTCATLDVESNADPDYVLAVIILHEERARADTFEPVSFIRNDTIH